MWSRVRQTAALRLHASPPSFVTRSDSTSATRIARKQDGVLRPIVRHRRMAGSIGLSSSLKLLRNGGSIGPDGHKIRNCSANEKTSALRTRQNASSKLVAFFSFSKLVYSSLCECVTRSFFVNFNGPISRAGSKKLTSTLAVFSHGSQPKNKTIFSELRPGP